MHTKNTVIFDLDGTLLDTLTDLTNSTNAALTQFGYPARTVEEVRSFVGNGILRLMTLALPGGQENPDFPAVFEAFKQHYGIHCNDVTKAYDGIMELLTYLQERKIKMAIVSNKADFAVKELNEIYFKDVIAIAIGEKENQGIRKKPAPDTVMEALRQLDSSVEESIYVGDSEVDLATARNCHMDAVLCAWGFRGKDFLQKEGADVIIDTPSQLCDYL